MSCSDDSPLYLVVYFVVIKLPDVFGNVVAIGVLVDLKRQFMLSELLFECSFSHAYVIFPGSVFVCCHFSVADNVSGEAVIVQGAVFFYAAVA